MFCPDKLSQYSISNGEKISFCIIDHPQSEQVVDSKGKWNCLHDMFLGKPDCLMFRAHQQACKLFQCQFLG